jgi:beta-N-acetylhexosaminidase
VGFDGFELDSLTAVKLKQINPAGVILYDCNIREKNQLKKLISDLKALLGEDLIVSVDQEGGKVERLRKVTSSLPSMQALGRASIISASGTDFDSSLIEDYSTLLVSSLREFGFNLVFAPCVDLATNPLNPIIGTRSLGSNPELVSKQAEIIINKLQASSIIACAKHFPGHGDTSKDSHLELPVIEFDPKTFKTHLEPFVRAIDSQVMTVMIAHLLIKNSFPDSEYSFDNLPTSISRTLIRGLLRSRLNFRGTIISDEITMKALSYFGDYSQLSQKMIEAGINLVVWNSNIDDALNSSIFLNDNHDANLLEAYQESLIYIQKLKSNLSHTKQIFHQKNLEQKMIEICRLAISNPLAKQLPEDFDVLVFNHPKLEIDVFKKVFSSSKKIIQYSTSTDIEAFEHNTKSLLVFTFQLDKRPDLITSIKNLNCQTLVISTDQEDSLADLHLYGTNEAHLRALLN